MSIEKVLYTAHAKATGGGIPLVIQLEFPSQSLSNATANRLPATRAARTFGYTAAEIIGQHVSVLIPPHLRTEEQRALEKLGRGERDLENAGSPLSRG